MKKTQSIKKAVNGDVLIAEKGEQYYTDPSNLKISNGKLGEVLKYEAGRVDSLIRLLDKAKDNIKELKKENEEFKKGLESLKQEFNDLKKIYEETIAGVLLR